MKSALLLVVIGLIALPIVAQNTPTDPANVPHQTVIDGKWEAKMMGQEKPIALFEFKNEIGVLSGTLTQDGRPTEIKNGVLEGTKIQFDTTQSGGGESVTTSWKGMILEDGEAIKFTFAPMGRDNQPAPAHEMEARRVK